MRIYPKSFSLKFLLLALALFAPFSAAAQTILPKATVALQSANAAAIEDFKLDSKLMARPMPYRVAFPKNYASNPQARFPVIYLLHGLTGHFDNWGDKTKIAEFLAPYNFIVVMPEGENGWFTDSASAPNDKYESYIVRELIPEIDRKFRTGANRENRIIAGLSMGGYGSIKFGLKYPEMFTLVGSFSGALPAASWSDKTLGNGWKALTDSIMSVYGAENSPTRVENDIYKIAREMPADKIKSLPFIYLDCGTEDILIAPNREFSGLLIEKKIPHEFRESPGAHTWSYWERQIQEFLRLSERRFSRAAVARN